MNMLHGLRTHRYALHSNLFATIHNFHEDFERRRSQHFNFENPFEDSPFSLEDCELLMPSPTQSFFYFYTCVDEKETKGIMNSKGEILAYANFDEAMVMSDNFVMLTKDGTYGFVNSINQKASDICYKFIDLQPSLSMNEQDADVKLVAIAKVEKNHFTRVGALDENGNILIPFEYDEIRYNVKSVTVRRFGDTATIPIKNLDPTKPITLQSSDDDFPSNEYDPDPWGAKAEMDYIRNNGGDWIDD